MTRAKRLLKPKTKEEKRSRLQGKHDKLREYEAIAKTELAKRDGTYKTGMNMADESDEEQGNKKPAAATNSAARRRIVSNSICPHCKRKGHKTKRSKHCLLYNGTPKNVPEVATGTTGTTIANAARNQLNGAVEDVDNFDAFPLTDDPPSDLSFSAFHDAGTWDDSSIDDCSQRGIL
jgi:leucyl aminopeptidase (aminopeptidase T)